MNHVKHVSRPLLNTTNVHYMTVKPWTITFLLIISIKAILKIILKNIESNSWLISTPEPRFS